MTNPFIKAGTATIDDPEFVREKFRQNVDLIWKRSADHTPISTTDWKLCEWNNPEPILVTNQITAIIEKMKTMEDREIGQLYISMD